MNTFTREQVETILRIVKGFSENRRFQAVLIGYTLGFELPISIDMDDPNMMVTVRQYFQSVPGELNELTLINLDVAQDVMNMVFKYRQAIAAGRGFSEHAQKFIELTGFAIGTEISENTMIALSQAINMQTETMRRSVEAYQEKMKR